MDGSGKWIMGGLMALMAILGLLMASRAQDSVFYFVGLLFFIFGVVFNFSLIGRYAGRSSS